MEEVIKAKKEKIKFSYKRKKEKPIQTICTVYHDDVPVSIGYAKCNLDAKDQPCRRAGRKIAKERALYALEHNTVLKTEKGWIMGEYLLTTKENI